MLGALERTFGHLSESGQWRVLEGYTERRMTGARSQRISAAVLGATGAVGQRMVSLLADHPWFELGELVASERSAGRAYGEAVSWRLPCPLPDAAARLVVRALPPTLHSRPKSTTG